MEYSTTSSRNHLINLLFSSLIFLAQIALTSSFPTEATPTRSGYLVVNSTTGSSIFYAFYEAQQPTTRLSNTPLLVWLQGGPGCSSMLANFNGVGPWRLRLDSNARFDDLEPNPAAWNRRFGVVFFDNPIGTGFSIASSYGDIPRDQDTIANHIYIAIKSFVSLDPVFQTRPVYVTGESYAGKYIPALGYFVAMRKKHHKKETEPFNLAGIAIGNGFTDPVHQVKIHAKNAYFLGLINQNQKWHLQRAQRTAVKLTLHRQWREATDARKGMLTMFQSMTGLATLYDVARKTPYTEHELTEKLLRSSRVKKALGANTRTKFKTCNEEVEAALHEDVMKSAKYMVDYLLEKVGMRVLIYEGQRDLQDGVVAAEAWLRRLKWGELVRFQAADRKAWMVNEELVGYVQSWGVLSHVVVLGAGHFVAVDQPISAQSMIEDWVLKKGLFLGGSTTGVLQKEDEYGYDVEDDFA